MTCILENICHHCEEFNNNNNNNKYYYYYIFPLPFTADAAQVILGTKVPDIKCTVSFFIIIPKKQ